MLSASVLLVPNFLIHYLDYGESFWGIGGGMIF
jgi:hypothetical protein